MSLVVAPLSDEAVAESKSVVLALLQAIGNGEPVRREVLEWYVEVLNGQLQTSMGSRPRRARLFAVLGSLVDADKVAVTVDGIGLLSDGQAEAEDELSRRPDLRDAVDARREASSDHFDLLYD